MAGKKRQAVKTAQFVGYIPVHLIEKEKKQIKANPGTPEHHLDRFAKYAEDGYRLSIGWDDYNDCMIASLYDTDVRRPSAGYVLAGRHTDLLTAIDILVYLHEIMYPEGWNTENINTKGDVSW